MTTLRADVNREPDGSLVVRLGGAIDERSELADLFSRLDADVLFHLGAIERVNSIGLHRWIPLVGKLSEAHAVSIAEVSYPLVWSANAVANLFGKASILSCLAPYFCEFCNESRTVIVTAEEAAASPAAPAKSCPVCHGALSFDELDTYFKFLTGRRPT